MSTLPHANASLYVGDLAPDVSEGHLFEVFKKSGPLSSIRVCRDAITRRSLGYAYVNFHDAEHASKALEDNNGKNIRGKPCRVMWVQRDPSLRKSGLGNIFIKNLDTSITHKELYDTFAEYGTILSCKIATDKEGGSKGFAFVHFKEAESAAKAIKAVNDKILKSQKVYVGPFISRKDRVTANSQETFTNVYVKDFPEEWDDKKLSEVFGKFGEIKSIYLATSKEGKSRGFAFVDFAKHEDAVAAVKELNETSEYTSGDKKLYVARFQKKAERQNELRKKHEEIKRKMYEKWRGTNLYIKNLDDTMDDKKLEELFAPFGKINSARIMVDKATGNSRGFGFVCFTLPEEAEKAMGEMNQKMIGSKPLFVALAQRKEDRKRQLEMQYARKGRLSMYPPNALYYSGMPNYAFPPMVRGTRGAWNPSYPSGYGAVAVTPNAGAPAGRGQRRQPAPAVATPPAITAAVDKPINNAELVNLSDEQRRQHLGEKLFPLIREFDEARAGKITGMLLERYKKTPEELLKLANTPEELKKKVNEAIGVLDKHMEKTT